MTKEYFLCAKLRNPQIIFAAFVRTAQSIWVLRLDRTRVVVKGRELGLEELPCHGWVTAALQHCGISNGQLAIQSRDPAAL